MNWSDVPDDQKQMLFEKVSQSPLRRLDGLSHIGQVYNDSRIPIIKRYKDDWATDEIAKTIASARRTAAYARKEATPNPKYAYNVANSAKRNPTAPRGRWDSMSQSVNHKHKGKKVQRTEEREQNISITLPDHVEQSSVDIHTTDTHSLTRTTPGRPEDTESRSRSPST